MLDDATAKSMYEKIDKVSHSVDYYKPFSTAGDNTKTGTTHLSIVDKDGSGLGATTSINA